MPKQEITKEQAWEVIGKPTIPRYVADLLEEYKSQEPEITFYGFIKSATNIGFTDNRSKEGKFTRWLTNKNENVVMKAWLAYPNIEIKESQE